MCHLQSVDGHLVLVAVDVDNIVLVVDLDDAMRARVWSGEWFAVAILAYVDIASAV